MRFITVTQSTASGTPVPPRTTSVNTEHIVRMLDNPNAGGGTLIVLTEGGPITVSQSLELLHAMCNGIT